jgi:hypothetical protein
MARREQANHARAGGERLETRWRRVARGRHAVWRMAVAFSDLGPGPRRARRPKESSGSHARHCLRHRDVVQRDIRDLLVAHVRRGRCRSSCRSSSSATTRRSRSRRSRFCSGKSNCQHRSGKRWHRGPSASARSRRRRERTPKERRSPSPSQPLNAHAWATSDKSGRATAASLIVRDGI